MEINRGIISTFFEDMKLHNTDNNEKSYLSSKSAYWNYFCRIMWHWRLE